MVGEGTVLLSQHGLPSSFLRGVGVAGSFGHRPARRSLLRPRILASSACCRAHQTLAAPQFTRRSLELRRRTGEIMD